MASLTHYPSDAALLHYQRRLQPGYRPPWLDSRSPPLEKPLIGHNCNNTGFVFANLANLSSYEYFACRCNLIAMFRHILYCSQCQKPRVS
ncbi:unnamed protein product [Dicrocoelium dendriticum]|nr:unnamed protein product [Dicrocoelium dendriticum]